MSMCTTIRARIMIAAIFFAALVARLPNFLDMRLVHKQLYDDNNGTYTKLVMEWRGTSTTTLSTPSSCRGS